MMRYIFLAGALCLSGHTVFASPDMECPGSSQIEIAECVAETEARVETALNTVLRRAEMQAAELDGITDRDIALPALRAAQAAWVDYRKAECDYAGALFGGGSGTGIAIRVCRIELTRARMRTLSSRW